MSDIDLNAVGRAIRSARHEKGFSQRELAASLVKRGWQIDHTALTRIETGQRNVRVQELVLIADALDVPIGRLIGAAISGSDLYAAGFAAGLCAAADAIRNLGRMS